MLFLFEYRNRPSHKQINHIHRYKHKVVKVEIFVDRQIKIVKRRRILHKKILNQGERKQPIEKNPQEIHYQDNHQSHVPKEISKQICNSAFFVHYINRFGKSTKKNDTPYIIV